MERRPVRMITPAERSRHTGADRVKVVHRDELPPGQRSSQIQFITPVIVKTDTAKTAAIAPAYYPLGVVVPPNAQAAIVLTTLSANTTGGGWTYLLFYPDLTGASINDAVSSAAVTMNSGFQNREQHVLPLFRDGLVWEFSKSGTVNWDYSIRLVGWWIG